MPIRIGCIANLVPCQADLPSQPGPSTHSLVAGSGTVFPKERRSRSLDAPSDADKGNLRRPRLPFLICRSTNLVVATKMSAAFNASYEDEVYVGVFFADNT